MNNPYVPNFVLEEKCIKPSLLLSPSLNQCVLLSWCTVDKAGKAKQNILRERNPRQEETIDRTIQGSHTPQRAVVCATAKSTPQEE